MKSDGKNRLLQVGLNKDILDSEIQCYHKFKEQTRPLVENLRGQSVEEQCRCIFAYLVEHVKYQLDPDGSQYIKSPARLLQDGMGDCKSLTMFICSCLHCLGVNHMFRFVNFDGGRQFCHVYAVALDEDGQEIVLDACELDDEGYPIFNYARPYKRNKDYTFYER